MGFFDSFKKKGSAISELAPPPAPQALSMPEQPPMPPAHPLPTSPPQNDPYGMDQSPPPTKPFTFQNDDNIYKPPESFSPETEDLPEPDAMSDMAGVNLPDLPDMQANYYNAVTQESAPQAAVQTTEVPETLPQIQPSAPQTEIPYFPEVEERNPILEEYPILDAEPFYTNFKKRRNFRQPLYIRTDTYAEMMTYMDDIKGVADASADFVYNLENLKRNADMEYKNYKDILEDVQRKIIFVDKILFKG